ncbi:MAG: ATP-dependent sacrificial sulfur transferase LarE [Syntrophorhabdaceae bacterium]|nr:ATP-dependent sacrificial sulfur transferase LarE [Syntrophorhabdaceae bacterium]
MNTEEKLATLKELIRGLGKVVVSFSGGVDSTFLLKISRDTIGRENVIAFMGISPTVPKREVKEAEDLSRLIDVELILENTGEMRDDRFVENNRLRCFYCKTHLFEKAWEIARKRGIDHVLEGSNIDDTEDYRPGLKACREMGVRSPLLEVGLKKEEIRYLSKSMNLPTFDKPSFACLSSRIPYGTHITPQLLNMVEVSEDYLKELGIKQVRVRYHNGIARIETQEDYFQILIEHRRSIVDRLKEIGFSYVTLDLEGYRTGSMNL